MTVPCSPTWPRTRCGPERSAKARLAFGVPHDDAHREAVAVAWLPPPRPTRPVIVDIVLYVNENLAPGGEEAARYFLGKYEELRPPWLPESAAAKARAAL